MNDTDFSSLSREALEQRLLTEPFDARLRLAYGDSLRVAGDLDAALAQADLLRQQSPAMAAGPLLAARVLLDMDKPADALAAYRDARGLEGFAPVAELDALAPVRRPVEAGHLQLVSDQPRAEVRSLQEAGRDKVRFSSIVGMEELKKTIRIKIIEPYLNPSLFARFRMQSGGGILLYGPPGCGKTMLARAVANECNAEFISVGISDVLNMWLGESERNLAAVFERARAATPCVLFFDELDALAFARAKAASSSARTVVNEFLSQLDGIGRENRGVLVLAATNMPWDVDDAMKRPGRFSRQIFVAPPDTAARRDMLRGKLVGVPCEELDLDAIAAGLAFFSGADIDGLIELAKEAALADGLGGRERGLTMADFDTAAAQVRPSTLEWLRTVRNVVKYAGGDATYKDVEKYLHRAGLM